MKMPKQFRVIFYTTSVLSMCILLISLYHINWDYQNILGLIIFSLLAVSSESLPVPLPKGGYVTVSYAIFISATFLFPNGVSLITAALSPLLILGNASSEQPIWKRIFNASQYVISLSFTLLVLKLFNITNFQFNVERIFIYLFSALVYMLTNVTIVSVALGILKRKSPMTILGGNIRWSIPNFLALAPLGILVAMIYTNYGAIGLLLLFVPLLLSRHSFQLYIEIRKNYLNTVEALVQALEAKDSYTSGHSGRVAQLSVQLAEELKLPEDRVEFIKYAGILHDVGKIGVSELILNKPGRLSDQEWEMIRSHPSIGQNIIKSIDFLFDVGQVVKYHHERVDGKGYPEGLTGDKIPLESKIIAIADTYDAITSDRSYRKGKTVDEALLELQKAAGTQLDAELVTAFCKIIRREQEAEEKLESVQYA